MNTDIRLQTSFLTHRKRRKLEARLGKAAVLSVIDLWLNAAINRPRGILHDMDCEDIALDANWDGDPKVFCSALVELKFMDLADGVYSIHDWEEHQSYAFHAEERSAIARNAAKARWEKRKACSEHASSMPDVPGEHAEGNAPSPVPAPNPPPSPDPSLSKEDIKVQNSEEPNDGSDMGNNYDINPPLTPHRDISECGNEPAEANRGPKIRVASDQRTDSTTGGVDGHTGLDQPCIHGVGGSLPDSINQDSEKDEGLKDYSRGDDRQGVRRGHREVLEIHQRLALEEDEESRSQVISKTETTGGRTNGQGGTDHHPGNYGVNSPGGDRKAAGEICEKDFHVKTIGGVDERRQEELRNGPNQPNAGNGSTGDPYIMEGAPRHGDKVEGGRIIQDSQAGGGQQTAPGDDGQPLSAALNPSEFGLESAGECGGVGGRTINHDGEREGGQQTLPGISGTSGTAGEDMRDSAGIDNSAHPDFGEGAGLRSCNKQENCREGVDKRYSERSSKKRNGKSLDLSGIDPGLLPVIEEFIEYRRVDKKDALSQLALTRALSGFAKSAKICKIPAEWVVRYAMIRGWLIARPQWIINSLDDIKLEFKEDEKEKPKHLVTCTECMGFKTCRNAATDKQVVCHTYTPKLALVQDKTPRVNTKNMSHRQRYMYELGETLEELEKNGSPF